MFYALFTNALCPVSWFPEKKKEKKKKKNIETVLKKRSEFSNISNTLFDQKSLGLSVPVVDSGDILIHLFLMQHTDIADSRLNWPRGRFSENPAYLIPLNL